VLTYVGTGGADRMEEYLKLNQGQKIEIKYRKIIENGMKFFIDDRFILDNSKRRRLINISSKLINREINRGGDLSREKEGRSSFFVDDFILKSDKKQVFCKKYDNFSMKNFKLRDVLNPLSLAFSSKAVKNFKLMLLLIKLNIPVSKPLLACSSSRYCSRYSLVLLEEVEGENADKIINDPMVSFEEKFSLT